MASPQQPSLSALVVHHLRATTGANDWDPEVLDCLQNVLRYSTTFQDPQPDVHDTATALRRWLDTIPEDVAARIDTLLPQDEPYFLACLIPPLCVWALSTDWGKDINVADATALAIDLLNTKAGTDKNQINATQAAARVLRDTMPLVRSHDAAWNFVGPWVVSMHPLLWPVALGLWEKQRHLLPSFLESWTAIAEATALADAKRTPTTQSTPLFERAQNKILNTLAILNDAEEIRFAERILRSSIPNDLKLKLCYLVYPSGWLDSTVRHQLVKILPLEETARLPYLPWRSYHAQDNRKVTFAYTPGLALLLDNVSNARVWEDRRAWDEMITSLRYTNAVVPAPIPGDAFDGLSPT